MSLNLKIISFSATLRDFHFVTGGASGLKQRDSSRILNHTTSIFEKLKTMNTIMSSRSASAAITKFFYQEVSLSEAMKVLRQEFPDINERVEAFIHRLQIEFHPTDNCNNLCQGCSYGVDISPLNKRDTFPFDKIPKMIRMLAPKAVTIVGGGEPTAYRDGQQYIDDVFSLFTDKSIKVGLISNGTMFQKGHGFQTLSWVRYSIDAGTPDTYVKLKKINNFHQVYNNYLRTLKETKIPAVGLGYVYRPENVLEIVKLITQVANDVEKENWPRTNIQFRPFRSYAETALLSDFALSEMDVFSYALSVIDATSNEKFRRFLVGNTNAKKVVNAGSKQVGEYDNCYFGMAKTVVRANGDLYPCFMKAISSEQQFKFGNILVDPVEAIALREIFVLHQRAKTMCVPNPGRCYLSPNNVLVASTRLNQLPSHYDDGTPDYFF